jgi:hypothetical protein
MSSRTTVALGVRQQAEEGTDRDLLRETLASSCQLVPLVDHLIGSRHMERHTCGVRARCWRLFQGSRLHQLERRHLLIRWRLQGICIRITHLSHLANGRLLLLMEQCLQLLQHGHLGPHLVFDLVCRHQWIPTLVSWA